MFTLKMLLYSKVWICVVCVFVYSHVLLLANLNFSLIALRQKDLQVQFELQKYRALSLPIFHLISFFIAQQIYYKTDDVTEVSFGFVSWK